MLPLVSKAFLQLGLEFVWYTVLHIFDMFSALASMENGNAQTCHASRTAQCGETLTSRRLTIKFTTLWDGTITIC
jgi:hypothetical protein